MNGIDGNMLGLLEKMLDVAAKRESLVASNIANVDTPGYTTKDIDFADAMKQAVARSRASRSGADEIGSPARPGAEGRVFEPAGLPRRNDLNNVSLDRELLALSKTAGRYNVTIELVRKRLALLRYAITEGRSGS